MSAFTVSAPASSANLGSGFDSVALALELRMVASIAELPAGQPSAWEWTGAQQPTHDGLRACIERGIVSVATAPPPLAIRIDNAIPLGAGLGSSAAAHALGVAIGARFIDRPLDDDALARAVVDLEGHPDNALAAWYGGVVIAAHDADGLHVARFAPPNVRVAVVVPELAFGTAASRALLPREVSHADAVYSVQRAALLGAALASGRMELLRAATRDRLHQPVRAAQLLGVPEMLALEGDGVYAVTLSGAGPSVLVLARDDEAARRTGHDAARIFAEHGIRARLLCPLPAASGVAASEGVPAGEANRPR